MTCALEYKDFFVKVLALLYEDMFSFCGCNEIFFGLTIYEKLKYVY